MNLEPQGRQPRLGGSKIDFNTRARLIQRRSLTLGSIDHLEEFFCR